MPNDPDDRYADILRRIAERKAQQQYTQRRDALTTALDLLNAADALSRVVVPDGRYIYGPRLIPARTSQGIVIWSCPKSYTGYKLLTVLGVWAQHTDEDIRVIVGSKRLPYSAAFFEAEAFYRLIRKGYDIYYSDDGAPPAPAARLLDVPYALSERLGQRQAIVDALAGFTFG